MHVAGLASGVTVGHGAMQPKNMQIVVWNCLAKINNTFSKMNIIGMCFSKICLNKCESIMCTNATPTITTGDLLFTVFFLINFKMTNTVLASLQTKRAISFTLFLLAIFFFFLKKYGATFQFWDIKAPATGRQGELVLIAILHQNVFMVQPQNFSRTDIWTFSWCNMSIWLGKCLILTFSDDYVFLLPWYMAHVLSFLVSVTLLGLLVLLLVCFAYSVMVLACWAVSYCSSFIQYMHASGEIVRVIIWSLHESGSKLQIMQRYLGHVHLRKSCASQR